MTGIKHHARLICVSLALALLAGCGSDRGQPLAQVASTVLGQLGPQDAAARDARSQLTPQVVAAVTDPFLLVSVPARQASATFAVFSRRDGRTDWRGADGISIVVVDDIVIATRGLGADLFLAEMDGLRSAIAGGSGAVTRRHHLLDGENQVVVATYDCRIATAGTEVISLIYREQETVKVAETCESTSGPAGGFTNLYWVDPLDGQVWQSEQWLNANIGSIVLTNLKR